MRVLHQVISAASPADAVTDQALAWQGLLRGWGVRSEVLAEHVHPELAGRVRRIGRGDGVLAEGPLLLRYSIWSGAVEAALAAPVPLGLVYHNVTPGDLLREANPEVAALCDRGRQGLRRLRGRPAALIADSSFNAAELRREGFGEARVVPPLLPPASTPERLAAPDPDRPLILSVGRIAPNKRLEDAIRAFALYQRHRAPGARLVLVGSEASFERYRHGLERLVRDLGARDVTFAGRVPDHERDGWYRRADAYLCTSVHEGFCVPLVEALAAGVPVVARARAAVPETLGGAGIAIPDDDLALFAEALHEAVTSETTREGLRRAAALRLTELAPGHVAERIREAVAPLVEAG